MTTITTRESVRQAVARALLLGPGDTEAAIAAVAQALGLDVETVRECTQPDEGWCCATGENLGVRVCDECDEASRAYSAAMAPVRDCVQEQEA